MGKNKNYPKELIQRMAEIKFYRICVMFYTPQGSLESMFAFIEILSTISNINTEALKRIAQSIIMTHRITPSKHEIIKLLAMEGLSYRQIREKEKCSFREISEAIHSEKATAVVIRPRLEEKEVTEILKFMGAFEKIQDVELN